MNRIRRRSTSSRLTAVQHAGQQVSARFVTANHCMQTGHVRMLRRARKRSECREASGRRTVGLADDLVQDVACVVTHRVAGPCVRPVALVRASPAGKGWRGARESEKERKATTRVGHRCSWLSLSLLGPIGHRFIACRKAGRETGSGLVQDAVVGMGDRFGTGACLGGRAARQRLSGGGRFVAHMCLAALQSQAVAGGPRKRRNLLLVGVERIQPQLRCSGILNGRNRNFCLQTYPDESRTSQIRASRGSMGLSGVCSPILNTVHGARWHSGSVG